MRKTILFIIGIILIVGAVFIAQWLIKINTKPEPVVKKVVKTVFTEVAENKDVPVIIEANGNLVAKNRIELYAEVQGVFNRSSKLFKAGQVFQKGDLLIGINSDEYYTSVQSAKSDLYNQITAIMPDLRLDYQDDYDQWQQYLQNFDINENIAPLPETTSDKVAYFINGRGINAAYYSVQNLEQRLRKYQIYAPFDGIVTEALVTKGTLVRNGQKLGEFIDTDLFELELSVEKQYSDLLEVNQEVELHTMNDSRSYSGKVSRINGRVDQATQTVKVFIEVKGENLKEGMYMEAALEAKKIPNAIRLSRKLLVNDDKIFIFKDSTLQELEVNPVYFSSKDMIIQGVPDGTKYVARTIPGAYSGMLVKENNEIPSTGAKSANSVSE